MVSAQHYRVSLPFLMAVGVRRAAEALHGGSPLSLQRQISMEDPLTLGKLLLLCQEKAGSGTGFESAGEWGAGEEFVFLAG